MKLDNEPLESVDEMSLEEGEQQQEMGIEEAALEDIKESDKKFLPPASELHNIIRQAFPNVGEVKLGDGEEKLVRMADLETWTYQDTPIDKLEISQQAEVIRYLRAGGVGV